jgi:hypothetical protein
MFFNFNSDDGAEGTDEEAPPVKHPGIINNFWASLEPYLGDITNEHLQLLLNQVRENHLFNRFKCKCKIIHKKILLGGFK